MSGRWSFGPHIDDHFDVAAAASTPQRPKTADATGTPRQHGVRKEDILHEHRQILSHLDNIMLRARAAVAKSTEMEREMRDLDLQHSSPSSSHWDQSGELRSASRFVHSDEAKAERRTAAAAQVPGPFTPSHHPSSASDLSARECQQHRSPMTEQLRLAQAQLRTRQEILRLQEQQIQIRSAHYGPVGASASQSDITTPPSSEQNRNLYQDQNFDSSSARDPNAYGGHSSNVHVADRLTKPSSDDRKPKLSTDLSQAMHRNYDAVRPQENDDTAGKTDGSGLERPLPSAEEFLKSLAEMRLNKQAEKSARTTGSSSNSKSRLDPEQLAQLGEHFKRLGIDTRPFQDLLGSPSNTRGVMGTAPVTATNSAEFEPAYPSAGVKRQLSFPEQLLGGAPRQQRAKADGEETTSASSIATTTTVARQPTIGDTGASPSATSTQTVQHSVKAIEPDIATTPTAVASVKSQPPSQALSSDETTALRISSSPDASPATQTTTFEPIESHPITSHVDAGSTLPAPNAVKATTPQTEEDAETAEKTALRRQVSGGGADPPPTPPQPGGALALGLPTDPQHGAVRDRYPENL